MRILYPPDTTAHPTQCSLCHTYNSSPVVYYLSDGNGPICIDCYNEKFNKYEDRTCTDYSKYLKDLYCWEYWTEDD